MIKLIFIGSICDIYPQRKDLGGWHFTRGKTYDIYPYENVHYVISDNDKHYYINIDNLSDFMTLQQWREQQINKLGI